MDSGRWKALAAGVIVIGAIVIGIARHDSPPASVATSDGSTTTLPVPSVPGLPDGLGGQWTLTAFTDGTTPLRPVTWDPRRIAFLSFISGLPTASGPVVQAAFTEDGCNSSHVDIAVHGAQITVDPGTYWSSASFAGTSSCPAGMLWTPPSVKALLLGPPPALRYARHGEVLTVENPTTGASLRAMRDSDIHAPLPADLKTPADLYGRWTPRSWTDARGSHDVQAPAGRDISISFHELGTGPFISFPIDCNIGSINTVTYGDGRITIDPSSVASTLMGCGDTWRLPAMQQLFGPDGHLRYQVVGTTLTLENVSARVTFIATRAG